MSKKIVFIVVVLLIAIGSIWAATPYALKLFGINSSSSLTTAGNFPELKLPTDEVFQISFENKGGQASKLPLAPVVIAQVTGRYQVARDTQFGIYGNIRSEMIAMNAATTTTETKTPRKSTIYFGKNISFEAPESPKLITGNIMYTTTNGITPLLSIITWNNLAVKDFDVWLKGITAAGFKKTSGITTGPASDKDKRVGNAYIYRRGNDFMEVMTVKDKKEEMLYLNLYMISPADRIVRQYLDELNNSIVNDLTRNGELKTGALIWRTMSPISLYRIEDSSENMGVAVASLTDRTFVGTDVPVINATQETWSGIPIGRSWLITLDDWNKIKDDLLKDILGRSDINLSELKDGARSGSDIFIKVENTGAIDAENRAIYKISVIDKKADMKVSIVFETFTSIDVNAIRKLVK